MQPHLDDKSNPAASRAGLEVHDSFVRFLFRNRPSGGTGLPQLDFYWFSIRFLGLDFHRFFLGLSLLLLMVLLLLLLLLLMLLLLLLLVFACCLFFIDFL